MREEKEFRKAFKKSCLSLFSFATLLGAEEERRKYNTHANQAEEA